MKPIAVAKLPVLILLFLALTPLPNLAEEASSREGFSQIKGKCWTKRDCTGTDLGPSTYKECKDNKGKAWEYNGRCIDTRTVCADMEKCSSPSSCDAKMPSSACQGNHCWPDPKWAHTCSLNSKDQLECCCVCEKEP